tara:strand:- start:147 stop:395 length:249 start_codon:yes stop_codon:yes gene_type:complete
MTNEYTFERRVIYTEFEYVEANSKKEAWEKVNSGDIEDSELGDFYDYYDEAELIEEIIGDPLVAMVAEYGTPEQYELFEYNG